MKTNMMTKIDILKFISYIRIKEPDGKLSPMILSKSQKKYLKYLCSIKN